MLITVNNTLLDASNNTAVLACSGINERIDLTYYLQTLLSTKLERFLKNKFITKEESK